MLLIELVLVVKNLPVNAGEVRDTGSIPESGRSPGEGNGTPLQYSCLGNPMDRGAWRAIVHVVAKSRTQTDQLSTEHIKIKELPDLCLVFKSDGCENLQQPLMLACVLMHFNVFLRPLVVGGGNVVLDEASGLLTSDYSQSTICTRVLRNWVCRGEVLESGRYPKDGIKSFTKKYFSKLSQGTGSDLREESRKGAGVEDKHEHLFFLN